jgi:hypothetical protein
MVKEVFRINPVPDVELGVTVKLGGEKVPHDTRVGKLEQVGWKTLDASPEAVTNAFHDEPWPGAGTAAVPGGRLLPFVNKIIENGPAEPATGVKS